MASYPHDLRTAHGEPITLRLAILLLTIFVLIGVATIAIAPLGATGDREVTALFSGQSAALGKDTDAATLVETLGQETTRRLRAIQG